MLGKFFRKKQNSDIGDQLDQALAQAKNNPEVVEMMAQELMKRQPDKFKNIQEAKAAVEQILGNEKLIAMLKKLPPSMMEKMMRQFMGGK